MGQMSLSCVCGLVARRAGVKVPINGAVFWSTDKWRFGRFWYGCLQAHGRADRAIDTMVTRDYRQNAGNIPDSSRSLWGSAEEQGCHHVSADGRVGREVLPNETAARRKLRICFGGILASGYLHLPELNKEKLLSSSIVSLKNLMLF